MATRNSAKRYKAPAEGEAAAEDISKQPAYTIDLTGLLWGDVKLLLNYDGKLTPQLLDLADRVVVGGVDKLPFFATVDDVFDAIWTEIERQKNPEAPVSARKRKN